MNTLFKKLFKPELYNREKRIEKVLFKYYSVMFFDTIDYINKINEGDFLKYTIKKIKIIKMLWTDINNKDDDYIIKKYITHNNNSFVIEDIIYYVLYNKEMNTDENELYRKYKINC